MGRKIKKEIPPLVPLKIKDFIFRKINKICKEENINDSHDIEIVFASFIYDLENYIQYSAEKCPLKKALRKLTFRIKDHIEYLQTSENEAEQYCLDI